MSSDLSRNCMCLTVTRSSFKLASSRSSVSVQFRFYVWGIFLLRLERKTVQCKTHESSGKEIKSKLTKLLLGWHYKCSVGSKCPLTNEGTAQPFSLHLSGSAASTVFSQREITEPDTASSVIPKMCKEC